jgi:hypothetical protein
MVPEKCGFTKGKSIENAAFKLTGNTLRPISQKMHVGGIFFNLAKIFDCVNHEILIVQLYFYGIQEYRQTGSNPS